MPWANVGPETILSARSERLRLEGAGVDQPVVEAPALAFLGSHRPPRIEKLGGAALADDARQDRAGAHVATRQPDPGEQEGGLGLRRREPDVRRHGDDGARSDGDAIHRGDDRLAAIEDRLDQIAGHPGEGEQLLHRPADQRPDDIVNIAAGTEIAAVGQEHHGVDIAGIGEASERIAQLLVRFEGQRVLAFRTVEADRGDATLDIPQKMPGLKAGHR